MPRRKQPDPADHPSLAPSPKALIVTPEISFIEPSATDEAPISEQRQHFQLPTRFGAAPVDDAPLGWEVMSESVSLNKDGVIANVQWDFNHKPGKFTSTQGYTFLRDKRPAGRRSSCSIPSRRPARSRSPARCRMTRAGNGRWCRRCKWSSMMSKQIIPRCSSEDEERASLGQPMIRRIILTTPKRNRHCCQICGDC